jgi:hypothetical protein
MYGRESLQPGQLIRVFITPNSRITETVVREAILMAYGADATFKATGQPYLLMRLKLGYAEYEITLEN